MALPGVSVSKIAGELSPVSAGTGKPLVIGPATGGTKNTTIYTFAQGADVNSTIGYGPAATAAQIIIADVGGAVDVIVSSGSATALPAVGTVTTGSGASITVSGTPYDAYQLTGEITTSGSFDAGGKFKVSLDGGQTYMSNIQLVGTYGIPNSGLTLTFASASHPLGQTFSCTTLAPAPSAADITNCFNTLAADGRTPSVVLIAGDWTDAASGSAAFTAVDSALTTLQTKEIFTVAVVPTGGVNGAASTTVAAVRGLSTTNQNGVSLVAERCRVSLPNPQPTYGNPLVPFAYPVASRIAGVKPSTNPAWVGLGGLSRCSAPTYDERLGGEVYNPDRVCAPTTVKGVGGTLLQQGWCKAPVTSPFIYVQWERVVNLACETANTALKKYINSVVKVKLDGTGTISEASAKLIEADIQSVLDTAIMGAVRDDGQTGHASGVKFAIDRTNNVLQSSTIQSSIRIVPLANASNITTQVAIVKSLEPVTVAAS